MVKYNELSVSSNKNKTRVGRGISAGRGKTAGRGTQGQNARTGKKLRVMFQGGQRPLAQAIPKNRGFKSLKAPAQVVYTDNLNSLSGVVDNFTLYEAGLIATPFHTVKVITRGEITTQIDLKIQSISASAKEALSNAGGSFDQVATPLPKSAKQSEAEDK